MMGFWSFIKLQSVLIPTYIVKVKFKLDLNYINEANLKKDLNFFFFFFFTENKNKKLIVN